MPEVYQLLSQDPFVWHIDMLSFVHWYYVRCSKPRRLHLKFSRVAGSGVKPSPLIVHGSLEFEEMPIVCLLRFDRLNGQ